MICTGCGGETEKQHNHGGHHRCNIRYHCLDDRCPVTFTELFYNRGGRTMIQQITHYDASLLKR